MEQKLTTSFLKEKGFYICTEDEYERGIYAIESDDKKFETDIDFWFNTKNPLDIQLKIWQIDKTVKGNHINKLMLDVQINVIEHARRFLNAFDINILN